MNIWFVDYLVKPWCRASTYLLGMLLAMLLHHTKRKLHLKSVSITNITYSCAIVRVCGRCSWAGNWLVWLL